MKSELVKEILKRLDAVGTVANKGIVEGVEFIFPLAVKQQIIIGFILTFFSFVIWVFSFYSLYNFKKNTSEDGFLFLAVATFIIAVFIFVMGIPQLLNPKYAAVEELLMLLR